MAVSPILGNPKPQYEDVVGDPYVGMRLFFYVAGTSTKQDTESDSVSGVINPNPIVIGADGYPENNVMIYGDNGYRFKVIAAPQGSDDPPTSPLWTIDDVAPSSELPNTILIREQTVAAMVADTALIPGITVKTVSYYGWSIVQPKGGAIYNIVSAADYTTITGNVSPDAFGDHLLVNGNVAMIAREQEFIVTQWGATGDGITDDTAAIKAVLLAVGPTYNSVFFPAGTYITTANIIIPQGVYILGESKTATVIKKTVDTSETIVDYLVTYSNQNCIFHMGGLQRNGGVEKIRFSGTGFCVGIQTGDNSNFQRYQELDITLCATGFLALASFWMSEVLNVRITSCEVGFDISVDSFKTSLVFRKCWAENCGIAYTFNKMQYSTVMSCGADYTAFKDASNPYGNGGFGSKSQTIGIYHFLSCDAVSVVSCGQELGFGLGVVHNESSNLTISGLRSASFSTEFTPAAAPAGVGIIYIGSSTSSTIVNGVAITGGITAPNAVGQTAIVASHITGSSVTDMAVIISGIEGEGAEPTFTGTDFAANPRKYWNLGTPSEGELHDMSFGSKITLEKKSFRQIITLTPSGVGQVISIPLIPQSSANRSDTIRIKWKTLPGNSSTSNAGVVEFVVGRLSTVKAALTIIQQDATDAITHTLGGLGTTTLTVTLSAAVTESIAIDIDVFSNTTTLNWDFDNITFV